MTDLNSKSKKRRFWFFILLIIIQIALGCSEANFDLAPESRLPKWFKLPSGMSRADVTVTMDYYIPPWGRMAVFTIFDKQGHKIAKVTGKQKGYSPNELKNPPPGFPPGYPSYEIITVEGVTDIIEHRKMEPIFYVTDDPNVWKELGLGQPSREHWGRCVPSVNTLDNPR